MKPDSLQNLKTNPIGNPFDHCCVGNCRNNPEFCKAHQVSMSLEKSKTFDETLSVMKEIENDNSMTGIKSLFAFENGIGDLIKNSTSKEQLEIVRSELKNLEVITKKYFRILNSHLQQKGHGPALEYLSKQTENFNNQISEKLIQLETQQ